MKTIKKMLIIFLFLNSFLYASLDDEFLLGITIQDFNIANKNRIKRVIKDISQKMNDVYNIKLSMVFYDNADEMFNDYFAYKNINSIIIWSNDFLEKKELLKKNSKRPFLFKNSTSAYTQYYLIANKKSKIKNIKDIKDKSFMTYLTKDNTRIWLDYLSQKTFNKSYTKVIQKELEAKRRSSLVLDVYFNKVDFCVVNKRIYDDMILLNPAIKKNIVLIKKSPEIFFYGLGLMNEKMKEKLSIKITDLLNGDDFYNRFEQLFKLIGIHSVKTIDFSYFKGVEQFYAEYKKVKR